MTYIWWILPKKIMARIKRMQQRIILLRNSRSADVSSVALNHARVETAIPAQEIIALRIVSKMTTIPSSKI